MKGVVPANEVSDDDFSASWYDLLEGDLPEAPSGAAIATGTTANLIATGESAFTSAGKTGPEHWREEAKRKGVSPESMVVRTPKKPMERYVSPEERHFGQLGVELRSALSTTPSRPDASDEATMYRFNQEIQNGYQPTPEDRETYRTLSARINRLSQQGEYVSRAQRALRQGDRQGLNDALDHLPSLSKYRQSL